MAASKPYTMFCGASEVLGGVLLLVPQLTTLGALITMGAMANVFALNMTYDVPVKLASLHYLLMALFLVAAEAKRLMNVLVLNRPAAAREPVPLSNRRWVNRGAVILSGVIGIVLLVTLTKFSLKRYVRENPPAPAPRPALYGVWSVDEFSLSPNTPGSSAAGSLFTAKLASDMDIGPGEDR